MTRLHIASTALPLSQDITIRQFALVADEPTDLGGNNAGPTPLEFLLASLGSCKAITIKMYAQRKEWALEQVSVDVRYQKDGDQPTIWVDLTLHGDLNLDQQQRLLAIADRCPIHKLLTGSALVIHTILHPSPSAVLPDPLPAADSPEPVPDGLAAPYRLVDCGFHDYLEVLATRRQPCILVYRTPTDEVMLPAARIVDLYAANHSDYLRLQDGTEIRLDHILSVNDQPLRFAD